MGVKNIASFFVSQLLKGKSDSSYIFLNKDIYFQLQPLSSFVYECINNISLVYFQNYFNKILNIHKISTRQAVTGDLFVEHHNTIRISNYMVCRAITD